LARLGVMDSRAGECAADSAGAHRPGQGLRTRMGRTLPERSYLYPMLTDVFRLKEVAEGFHVPPSQSPLDAALLQAPKEELFRSRLGRGPPSPLGDV
jgi:hypothetical protein